LQLLTREAVKHRRFVSSEIGVIYLWRISLRTADGAGVDEPLRLGVHFKPVILAGTHVLSPSQNLLLNSIAR